MFDLMSNIEAQTYLLKIRGITKDTARHVILGYDSEKQRWVIPTIKYSTTYGTYLLGFEYRPLDFNKSGLSREKGTPTSLAQINCYNDQKYIVIVEGYFDGYALYQHLTDTNKINDFHIVTCSNGAGSLLNQLSAVNFSVYEKCYSLIDNDEVSIPIAQKICEKYPQIINLTPQIFKNCDCKDFNEHYLRCIYKQKKQELTNIKNIDDLTNFVKENGTITATEKLNKTYCKNKAKNKETIILECIKYFNNRFNTTYIAKILTGTKNYYDTLKDTPEIANSSYYEIFTRLDYANIKQLINKLIEEGKIKRADCRKSSRIYIP